MEIGLIFAFLTMLSFGLSPLFYKYATNSGINPFVINWMRSIGALFLTLTLLPIFLPFSFPNIYGWILVVLISIIGPFLGDTIYMASMKYIDLSYASPLSSTYPLFLIVFSIIFSSQIPGILEITGSLLVISGIFVSQVKREKISKTGFTLALIAALLYAIAIYLIGIALNIINAYLLTILRILFTIIFLTPLTVNKNIPKNPKLWLLLSIGGFFGIGISYVFMLLAILDIGVVITGIISSASPMITIILSILIFRESREIKKLVGIVLIMSGLLILSI